MPPLGDRLDGHPPAEERARSAITSKPARRRSPGASSAISASTHAVALDDANRYPCRGPRLIAWCSASRMIWKIATCACSVRFFRGLDVEVDLDLFAIPSWSASALTAGRTPVAKHDGLELEREVAQRANRLTLLLERGAEHLRRFLRPAALDRCDTASSISAIPDIDCTGPSWKKSAMRRRSSCSAVISWSDSRACSVESRSQLFLDALVLVPLGHEQRGGERTRGGHREDQARGGRAIPRPRQARPRPRLRRRGPAR